MSARLLFVIWFLILCTVVVVIFAYWRYSSDVGIAGKIDFAAKSAFSCAAVASLFVGYQTLRLNIHQKQIDAAFLLLARYDKEDERKARRKVEALIAKTGRLREYQDDAVPPLRIEGFSQAIQSDENLEEAINTILGYFEDVSLALKSGYASEAILYRSIHPTAIKLVTALRPYVHHYRRREGTDVYYEDAVDLATRWRKGLSVRSRSARNRFV